MTLYIKTDALISGGNSGGPLLRDGKIVWLNTFTANSGWAIGYALSSKDIQVFLDKAPTQWSYIQKYSYVFVQFLNNLRAAQKTWLVKDDVFDFTLPTQYKPIWYIPGKSVVYNTTLPDRGDISTILVWVHTTPEIETESEYLYMLESHGQYNPSYQKMQEIALGGTSFKQIIQKDDPSQWKADGMKLYVSKLSNRSYVTIILFGDNELDESLFEKNQLKIREILSNISFSKPVDQVWWNIVFYEPFMSFGAWRENGNFWFGWVSFIQPKKREIYIKSLYEKITIDVREQSREEWKWATIQTIFESATKNVDTTDKWLVKVWGYDGYMYCIWDEVYVESLQWEQKRLWYCNTTIVVSWSDSNESYLVEIDLYADMKNFDLYKMLYGTYIDRLVTLWDATWETTVLSYLKKVDIPYLDLTGQLIGFDKTLERLLKYDILDPGRVFWWERAVTRWEFISMYSHMVYGTTKSDLLVDEILQISTDELWIDISSYVKNDQIELYHLSMQLALAGIDIQSLDTQNIFDVFWYEDTLHTVWFEKFKDWEYDFYGKRKISLDEATTAVEYKNKTQSWYHPQVGVLWFPYFIDWTPQFGDENMIISQEYIYEKFMDVYCSAQIDTDCDITTSPIYEVLTYGEMLNALI